MWEERKEKAGRATVVNHRKTGRSGHGRSVTCMCENVQFHQQILEKFAIRCGKGRRGGWFVKTCYDVVA